MAVAMRDPDAFAALVEPHRRELLGEWKGLSGFEGRSSLRSWLHASCGNAMRAQQFGGALVGVLD